MQSFLRKLNAYAYDESFVKAKLKAHAYDASFLRKLLGGSPHEYLALHSRT